MSNSVDPRLGLRNDDGSIAAYPITDIFGRHFEKPPTTFELPNNHFCITPVGVADDAILSELRQLAGGGSSRRRSRAADEGDDE